ncbi:MAG: hypothetical protein QXS38_01305 [Candidatus Pacearchaeota archaeon]
MSAEYVKIRAPELIYGETNLLQAQFSLLSILKQYREYGLLRKEELFLKIELKKKIGEAREFLDNLSRLLPESRFIEEQEKKEKIQKELVNKIESAILRAKRRELKPWKEKGEEPRKSFLDVIKETEASEKKDVAEAESPIEKELEEIRRKLEKLQ